VVGYKTERYLRFGWCGARLDDLMNLLPSRLTWLLIAGAAALIPGGSGKGALKIGWRQHAIVPGPNAGWSEAALAGAIRRRLAGPIWLDGRQVTDVWIGDPAAPAAGTSADCRQARQTLLVTAAVVVGAGVVLLAVVG
jgi:adenosylcobinamide-phosphate synthase